MAFDLQNFYKSTLSLDWTIGIGTFYVTAKPTVSTGWLVISPNNTTTREIIRYTSTGTDSNGDYVVVSVRGVGGTTEQIHSVGEPIRMNITAEYWDAMNDDIAAIVASGVSNANTTTMGGVEIATDAEVVAGTNTGGTGASLVATPGQILKNIRIIDGKFGDGSDGDVTISVNTTLSRDMYYQNLTIDASVTLIPLGYKIYVQGTLTNNGTISNNGGNGGNGTGAAGGTAGVATGGGTAGQAGGFGAAGVNGTAVNPSLGVAGSRGGRGADGGGGKPGGTAGAATSETVQALIDTSFGNLTGGAEISKNLFIYLLGSSSGEVLSTSAGSGSGGGGTASGNSGGGGSGASGGKLTIIAATIINNGTISSNGGNGGNGSSSEAGGGAGGAGGVILLVYKSITVGTITVTGGTKGSDSVFAEANNGNDGVIFRLKLTSVL